MRRYKAFLAGLTASFIIMSGCINEMRADEEQSAVSESSIGSTSKAASLQASSSKLEENDTLKTTPAPLPDEWMETDDIAAINIAVNDAAYENSLSNIGDMLENDISVGSVMCVDKECLEVRFSTDATNFYYILAYDELDNMNEKAVVVRNVTAKRDSSEQAEKRDSDRHYKVSEVFEPFPEHISRDEVENIAFSDAGLDTSKPMFKQLEGSVGINTDSNLCPTYFEIKFSTKEHTFKYKIDAATGEILEKNVE